MKKQLSTMILTLCFLLPTLPSKAAIDPYFAMGEDLDFLLESQSTLALEEIEYKLRRFMIYRKLERLFTDVSYYYIEDEN